MHISTLRLSFGFLVAPGLPALALYWLNRALDKQGPELLGWLRASGERRILVAGG